MPNDATNLLIDFGATRVKSIIVQNNVKRTVDWGGKNGQTISITPIGIDPVDNFIDFTFEKDGEEVYKRVVAMLDGKLKPKKDTSKKAVAK